MVVLVNNQPSQSVHDSVGKINFAESYIVGELLDMFYILPSTFIPSNTLK